MTDRTTVPASLRYADRAEVCIAIQRYTGQTSVRVSRHDIDDDGEWSVTATINNPCPLVLRTYSPPGLAGCNLSVGLTTTDIGEIWAWYIGA